MEFGIDEPQQKNKWALLVSEYFGMLTFMTLSLNNIVIYSLLPSGMSWEGVSFAWGLNLLLGIKIAKYGNAYLNPCIAACDFLLSKKISLCEFAIYVTAEVLGAFSAAAITYGLNSNLYPDDICKYFATSPAEGINHTQAFFIELIGTFLFALCIFKISSADYAEYAIAGSLTTVVMSMGYQTAFSYNWARDFGPRLLATAINVDCMDTYTIIPFFANFVGAFCGWIAANI
jgi:aquaglyceroporin related protein, other eukaryote